MDTNLFRAAILFSEADKSSLENFEKDATAIYAVGKNRAANTKRWGYSSVDEAFADTNQFSGYGTKEYQKVISGNMTEEEQKFFKKALQIIKGYESGLIEDPTGGADHYYNPKLANPSWGKLTDEEKVGVGYNYYPETYKTSGHSYRKETLRKRKSKKSE